MTPARLLAPVALVAAAVALFAVVTSGTDHTDRSEAPSATVAPKATPAKKKDAKATPTPERSGGATYIVKAGDSPYSIAQANGIEVAELLEANPDADANALHVGQKLKLP